MNKLKQFFAKIYRESEAVESDVDSLTVALMGSFRPSMLVRVSSHISINPEHMPNQMKRALGEKLMPPRKRILTVVEFLANGRRRW